MRGLAVVALVSLAATLGADEAGDYERARRLLVQGHPAEAAAIYRALASADPTNADVRLNLTIALYKARDFRGAVESAKEALQRKPDLLPARLLLGGSDLELGEYANSIAELERVLEADPNERNGRLLLGKALLAAGQPQRAAVQLEAATELLPANSAAWYALGRAREALGQTQAANDAWQRLAAIPPSAELHIHAAEVHAREQSWQAAAREWREALQLQPDRADSRLGLGEALYRLRDYAGAMAALAPLLPAEFPQALFLYGGSLMNLQQPAEAIPYLRAAVARDPGTLPARAALGQALLQTGKPQEAIPFLLAALPGDNDGSTHFQLFRAYQLTNRKDEARRMLAEFQRLREPPASR